MRKTTIKDISAQEQTERKKKQKKKKRAEKGREERKGKDGKRRSERKKIICRNFLSGRCHLGKTK